MGEEGVIHLSRQQAIVLHALRRMVEVDNGYFARALGVLAYAQRVRDLRRHGFTIDTVTRNARHGYYSYKLREEPAVRVTSPISLPGFELRGKRPATLSADDLARFQAEQALVVDDPRR